MNECADHDGMVRFGRQLLQRGVQALVVPPEPLPLCHVRPRTNNCLSMENRLWVVSWR